jgi:hypothetical protein
MVSTVVGIVVVTIVAPRGDGGYCSWLFVSLIVPMLVSLIGLVVRHRGSGTPFATCCCDVAAVLGVACAACVWAVVCARSCERCWKSLCSCK